MTRGLLIQHFVPVEIKFRISLGETNCLLATVYPALPLTYKYSINLEYAISVPITDGLSHDQIETIGEKIGNKTVHTQGSLCPHKRFEYGVSVITPFYSKKSHKICRSFH